MSDASLKAPSLLPRLPRLARPAVRADTPEASRARTGVLFTLPAIVLMLVILIVPILMAGVLSFTDYSLGRAGFDWVGVQNYEHLLSRSAYRSMFVATLTYVFVVVPASVGLGLGAALLISSLRVGGDFYKTIYFLPVMAALLAMAIVWEFALHPTLGIVNSTLAAGCDIGWLRGLLTGAWLGGDPAASWYGQGCADGFPLWLGDRDYAIWTLCFIGIWQAFGFNMVLYLAGLTGIPRELYHAAEMDGAKSGWERFRLVTWPKLGPTTVFVVTITSIRSFQVFDQVEALTSGGPMKSTYVMMYAIYEKAIQQNLIGIGAAITMVFLGFVLLMTLIQRHLVERRVHYS
ncbi:carbohydrate ABC transporter permease [Fodinicurvata fenggangensis]|uniref:carbohydrate ABC transporter permease n=1 Tax=Fodinicurvata fenggangensis TaxID=1121830 RepID=UPI0009DFD87F|nr:sugar ABC transporter permease [Fodinicurvata fenggangensis]